MRNHDHHDGAIAAHEAVEQFSSEVEGLPAWTSPETVRLRDGDEFELRIHPMRKRIGDAEVRMLGYNGSIPGPTLHVDQGSEITVHVENEGDVETTVHWHGLRLENRLDGVPEETQAPIERGGSFTYKVQFPDPGLYWYHPHIREDFAQEMGLYAPIVVEPSDPSYWPAADRQLTITLDDVLIEDGKMSPFSRSGPNFVAMGRFGNVMLINGETEFSGEASVGEVVRLFLVNTANTRIFNFALRGARMKLIGGDSGRYEREEFVDEVLLSPSERAVVDVLFDAPGDVRLEHRSPDFTYDLGAFAVAGTATGSSARSFEDLRTDPELAAERRAMQTDFEREPDKVLSFVASMPLLYGDEARLASHYVCPMHSDVTSSEQSTCPKCGMKLVPAVDENPAPTSYVCPMHPEVTSSTQKTCPKCGMKLVPSDSLGMSAETSHEGHAHDHDGHDHGGHNHGSHEHGDHGDGLEWEDLMPEINRASDPTNMIWKLIDRETDAENHRISWAFTAGDRVKIRLVNEMDSDHPMHHPFHVYGAGRFLVLSRDGETETNLVWKDTVLLRAGETVDILLYVTNPGVVDGALPHRRAHRERDDVQLRSPGGGHPGFGKGDELMGRQKLRERWISVVVYPGLTTLELIGTVSVLDGLGLETGFNPVTVGENRDPVSPNTPLELVPQAIFEDVSRPFGLLVPGGGPNVIAAMGDERLLGYVRSAAEEAELVASVGTGSLILAAAGLLEGRRATAPPTYRGILANLGAEYADDTWVENGKFTTSGGTSGGIDMGLHLVTKHRNRRSARQVQLWVEYDPQPPFGPMDRDATGDELARLLARHRVDPEQSLAHRPDPLEAVRGALRPAARAKTGR